MAILPDPAAYLPLADAAALTAAATPSPSQAGGQAGGHGRGQGRGQGGGRAGSQGGGGVHAASRPAVRLTESQARAVFDASYTGGPSGRTFCDFIGTLILILTLALILSLPLTLT